MLKVQFIHSVNGDGSKTAKIIEYVILLSITLTSRRWLVMSWFISILLLFSIVTNMSLWLQNSLIIKFYLLMATNKRE